MFLSAHKHMKGGISSFCTASAFTQTNNLYCYEQPTRHHSKMKMAQCQTQIHTNPDWRIEWKFYFILQRWSIRVNIIYIFDSLYISQQQQKKTPVPFVKVCETIFPICTHTRTHAVLYSLINAISFLYFVSYWTVCECMRAMFGFFPFSFVFS